MPEEWGFSSARNKWDGIDSIRRSFSRLDLLDAAKDGARACLLKALSDAVRAGDLPDKEPADFVVEVPADTTHGDLAANLALVSARAFSASPRKIAETILAHFPKSSAISRVEIAGPGFINMFLADEYFSAVVLAACACGEEYGRTAVGEGQRVNVEFVSANPTGPMHLGNARGAALGDTLAAALEWAGYEVTREFYINDAGNQIAKFGKSLAARYIQLVKGEGAAEFPEDGYQGEDIRVRAEEFRAQYGDGWAERPAEALEKALVDYALPKNVKSLRDDLEKYRVHYDVWFSEQSLHDSGAVAKAVETLGQRGATYEKDGAVWYKATAYGGEKDEVLVRANGVPTYFAADIAYHANKFGRGYARAIDAWGADHHGHVARMKGALDAIGLDGSKLDIVLFQFVRLVRGGEQVRMSKRTGKAITLTDLLEEVPIDSARFFFNMREPGSTIEFDLDLAVAQDSENPVYYVQYAHARICSILRALAAEGVTLQLPGSVASLSLLTCPDERALIRHIAAFPGEIVAAAHGYDPARITRYAVELATGFHKFYTTCRVKGEEAGLQQARLALCTAAKNALSNALTLLKVSVPERM